MDDFTVTMSDDRFEPERLVVPVGSTITWVNADKRTHSVVTAQVEDPDIRLTETWCHTLTQSGT